MARQRPGALAATQRIIAGALLFVGLFVFCFGLGMGEQGVLVAGGVITVLALGGRLASTMRRNPRRWLRGTGRVLEVSEPPTDSRYGRCSIQLVIDVLGLPQETVTVRESRVSVGQWPYPGQELPIQVAADDQRYLRVLWRTVPPAGTAAQPAWDEQPGWDEEPASSAAAGNDQIDFDLDGPPTITLTPVPPAEGRRVPRPRPSPHPRRQREPVPVGAAVAATGADGDRSRVGELVTTYPSAHPGPAGAINGVGVTVLVSDLERSVAFYRDQLGFYEVDGADDSTVLASGETRLVLRRAAGLGPVDRRLVHLNLEVADIDAMYAELKANGIRFLYPPRSISRSARLELWAAAFRDPDGHGIALTQWRSPTG